MTIAAVVVTYNRLVLLRECLDAISRQTYQVCKIVVINNASTDGTTEFLQKIDNKDLFVKSFEKNIGGAGGFAEGIAIATKMGVDAIWIMDDDTIPQTDALDNLIRILKRKENIGFVNSKVVWTDGNIHQMNIPGYVNHYDLGGGLYAVRSASFVSLLVPSKIVKEVGLPYREFFIWVDDAEFTSRIVKAGYKGYLTTSSIVIHKTTTNYGASIKTATLESAWKFYYYMRNGMFASRGEKPWIVWFFKYLNHLRLDIHRTRKMPPELRNLLKKNLCKGFIDGLTFSPQKEFID
jgi:GT2 family glycosyltransferase